MTRTRKTKISAHERFHRDHIYALELMQNREFLVVNRKYKPLGFASADHADYEAEATLPLSADVVRRVAVNHTTNDGINAYGYNSLETYWLYCDAFCPFRNSVNMRAYKAKLEALGLPFGLDKKLNLGEPL